MIGKDVILNYLKMYKICSFLDVVVVFGMMYICINQVVNILVKQGVLVVEVCVWCMVYYWLVIEEEIVGRKSINQIFNECW